jgi:hypothetical protein
LKCAAPTKFNPETGNCDSPIEGQPCNGDPQKEFDSIKKACFCKDPDKVPHIKTGECICKDEVNKRIDAATGKCICNESNKLPDADGMCDFPKDVDGYTSPLYIAYSPLAYEVGQNGVTSIKVKTIIPEERVYQEGADGVTGFQNIASLFRKLARHQSGVVEVCMEIDGVKKWLTNDGGKTRDQLANMQDWEFTLDVKGLPVCSDPSLSEKKGYLGGLYLNYFNDGTETLSITPRVHIPQGPGGRVRQYYNIGDGDKLKYQSGNKLPMPDGIAFHTATCRGEIPNVGDLEVKPISPNPAGMGFETKFLGYGPVRDFVDVSTITNPNNVSVAPYTCEEYLGMSAVIDDNKYLYLLKPVGENKCFGGGVLGDTGVDGQTPFVAEHRFNLTENTRAFTPPPSSNRFRFC